MAKYKLIIIDDEFLVVKGLKETVDWASLDVEVVATASNGEEGLKAIRRYRPDLVISDIRMPVSDGLTLAQTLAREQFDCALIIYSGYSDFDYVSKAMEFGVTRYLLKPIDSEVLVEKVREVLYKLESERESRKAVEQYRMGLPLLKSNLLKKLLEGKDAGEAESDLKKIGVQVPKSGVVIHCAPLGLGSGDTESALQEAFSSLMGILESFGAVGCDLGEGFCIVTALADVHTLYIQVKRVLDELADKSKLVAGISAPYGHGTTLQQGYERAVELTYNYLFFSASNVVTDGESPSVGKTDKLIADALQIITTRYSEKIGVKEVAEKLFISESHLMHHFKERLGKTFNDCLTEYRMQKARQQLSDTKMSVRVKEVAANVGYADVKYFSQLFKEYFGVSPREYAERRL